MLAGVDIGGTKCAVVFGDENGNIVKKVKFATAGRDETLAEIKEILKTEKFDAIGVSCGGPLDEKNGIIMSPPNLIGFDDVHITEILQKEFGVPVRLCNDANASALAEYKYGAGKGTENMVFLTFGTGMGAGLILGGRLYSGTNGNAGEVGHIRLSPFGPSGYGKCGSFEGFCSGGGIAEMGRQFLLEAKQNGVTPLYAEKENFTAADIADAARKGDKYALKIFEISAEKLGEGLSVIIDILNPERIVIGSIYARCTDLFEPAVRKVTEREALKNSLSVCRVVPAALGEKIGDMAALAVALTASEGK